MTRKVKVFVAGIKSPRTNLCQVYHWQCGLKRMLHIGGTISRQLTLTIKGLSGVPLVGGLCHVQWTLTTRGLNELPLIGGLCLVQWTSTTMAN
jgi:hypothetical protein